MLSLRNRFFKNTYFMFLDGDGKMKENCYEHYISLRTEVYYTHNVYLALTGPLKNKIIEHKKIKTEDIVIFYIGRRS